MFFLKDKRGLFVQDLWLQKCVNNLTILESVRYTNMYFYDIDCIRFLKNICLADLTMQVSSEIVSQ